MTLWLCNFSGITTTDKRFATKRHGAIGRRNLNAGLSQKELPPKWRVHCICGSWLRWLKARHFAHLNTLKSSNEDGWKALGFTFHNVQLPPLGHTSDHDSTHLSTGKKNNAHRQQSTKITKNHQTRNVNKALHQSYCIFDNARMIQVAMTRNMYSLISTPQIYVPLELNKCLENVAQKLERHERKVEVIRYLANKRFHNAINQGIWIINLTILTFVENSKFSV